MVYKGRTKLKETSPALTIINREWAPGMGIGVHTVAVLSELYPPTQVMPFEKKRG